MTVTEQLQFSVLAAPVAAVDRRSLSQAWYSALYGNAGNAGSSPQAMRAQSKTPLAAHRALPVRERLEERASLGARSQATKATAQLEGAPVDRRAPRSALARSIERAFLRPRTTPRREAFTVESEYGRVHVLLHSRGDRLQLVAICPPKARAGVAAALAQARYALAARGIDLDAQTREAPGC